MMPKLSEGQIKVLYRVRCEFRSYSTDDLPILCSNVRAQIVRTAKRLQEEVN